MFCNLGMDDYPATEVQEGVDAEVVNASLVRQAQIRKLASVAPASTWSTEISKAKRALYWCRPSFDSSLSYVLMRCQSSCSPVYGSGRPTPRLRHVWCWRSELMPLARSLWSPVFRVTCCGMDGGLHLTHWAFPRY